MSSKNIRESPGDHIFNGLFFQMRALRFKDTAKTVDDRSGFLEMRNPGLLKTSMILQTEFPDTFQGSDCCKEASILALRCIEGSCPLGGNNRKTWGSPSETLYIPSFPQITLGGLSGLSGYMAGNGDII